MTQRPRFSLLGAAVAGLLVGSAAGAIAAPAPFDPSACGLPATTPVLASFDATPAKGIWNRLPALARSPELEEVTGTAHVMILGDVAPPAMVGGSGPRPASLPNAVCVVIPSGPILYYNVSRQGFVAP